MSKIDIFKLHFQCASFPTLNIYIDGIKVVKYPQDRQRTLEDLENFVYNLEVPPKDELWNLVRENIFFNFYNTSYNISVKMIKNWVFK